MKQREHLEELAADEIILLNFLLYNVRENNRIGQGNM
jgi:hypothetical protein